MLHQQNNTHTQTDLAIYGRATITDNSMNTPGHGVYGVLRLSMVLGYPLLSERSAHLGDCIFFCD